MVSKGLKIFSGDVKLVMTRLMPALSDGRAFTSYVSAGQREEALMRQAGAINENQYRQYMQRNGQELVKMLSTTMNAPGFFRQKN